MSISYLLNKNISKSILVLVVSCLFFLSNSITVSATVLDDIKADMTVNEAPLWNTSTSTGWSKEAIMSMGNTPRGDNTPYYWNPASTSIKSSEYWKAAAPWFVIYPAVGHATTVTNTRVKISGLKLYAFDTSINKWKLLRDYPKTVWGGNYGFNLIGSYGTANTRVEPDGNLSYKMTNQAYPIHGGWGKDDLATTLGIDPRNIGAIFEYTTTELILDDPKGIDDRDKAKLMLSVGMDYYPTVKTNVSDFEPYPYAPNAAASRFGLIGKKPRTHYMATINPPGSPKNISTYVINGGVTSMPIDKFTSNLPPLPEMTPVTTSSAVSTQGNTPVTPSSGNVTTTPTVPVITNPITSDIISPTVSIVPPTNGTNVSGLYKVKVTASDNSGIKSVTLFVDNLKKEIDYKSPYTFALDTKALANGVHYITARAVDKSGNKATSSVLAVNVQNNSTTNKTNQVIATNQEKGIATTTNNFVPAPLSTTTPVISNKCTGIISERLAYGMENNQVKTLQCKLAELGYLTPDSVIGYFGPKTFNAVKQLQCASGLVCTGDVNSTGYGLVGPKTKAVLGF